MTAEIFCMERYRHAKMGARAPASQLLDRRPFERGRGMAFMPRRQEPRWADHRDALRHCVKGAWISRVAINGRTASLEDISKTGLKVRCDVHVQPGADVIVTILGCPPFTGQVIWTRGGAMGLEAPLGSMPPLAR